MKALFKNLKIKESSMEDLVTIFKIISEQVPLTIPEDKTYEYDLFYSELLNQYKEIPDHDFLLPEDTLHLGLVVKMLWESGIRESSDIDILDPSQYRRGSLYSKFDLRISGSEEILERFEIELQKLYDYDRD